MKKLKICHVITRLDWGGSPDLVRVLCERLSPERFDVTLITGETRFPSRATRDFLAAFGARIIIIPRLKRAISPFDDLSALFALYRVFRAARFDIVHTHTAKAGFLGRTAAFLAGCRCIVHTPHGHNFYGYFGRAMTRLIVLLERCAALYTRVIVVLTGLEKGDYLRFKVCRESKLALIPSAIAPEFFSAPGASREETRKAFGVSGRVVGLVARLEPVKGPEYFIDAAREISGVFPDCYFIVAGEGSLRDELVSRAGRYGLEERFIFTGWRDDIPRIISCLDVLVLPSLNEAVGLVLLQAQAAGVPVVASSVGGVAEAVRDGETGVLVPPADVPALAKAVCRILGDKTAADQMGRRGRAWVAGRFSIEQMVKSHEVLYREVLGMKS